MAYFGRVGLDGAPPADVGGLHDLHRAQFFSIPFENLDILLGLGVDLDPDTVFEKLVTRRRGGYCFELFHVTPEDIEVGNHYTSTSPRTHFTRMAVVSIPTPTGRLSLRDGVVTEVEDGASRRFDIDSSSIGSFLYDRFGLQLERLPSHLT